MVRRWSTVPISLSYTTPSETLLIRTCSLQAATAGRVQLTEEEARGPLTADGCLAHLEGARGGIVFRPGGTGAWTVNERMLTARGVTAEHLQVTLASLPLPPLPEPDARLQSKVSGQ
jgi:hypothetical protein